MKYGILPQKDLSGCNSFPFVATHTRIVKPHDLAYSEGHMPPQQKKFLHLLLLSGAEYDALKKLRAAFASYEDVWRASASALQTAGLGEERILAITDMREKLAPDDEMRKLVAAGIALVALEDPEYPADLRHLAQAPFGLYIKGRMSQKPRIAVVGTRKATSYGREAVKKVIADLARAADIAIVSGLAQGIDAQAHRSALDERLETIGVIGSGMDRASFFPPENYGLAEEIVAKGGAVISEYPPGAPGLKHHFPARNRIIAGLAAGTLVAEAPEKSGALITANFALEQGREVFAIPGPLFSPTSTGVHRLIQNGAKLVSSADDILNEVDIPRREAPIAAAAVLTDATERTIVELLREPQSVDDIKLATQLPTPDIITCISVLELKGLIRPMGQNRYQRVL